MEQWRAWSCSSRQIKAFLSLCRCLWARDKAEERSQARERRAPAACCHRSSRLLFNLQASDHRLHCRTGHSRATYVTGLPRPIQGTAPKSSQAPTRARPLFNCLQPPPYQLDQSSHACLTEPRFSLVGDALPSRCFASMHIPVIWVDVETCWPLPLCCVEVGAALLWTPRPFCSEPLLENSAVPLVALCLELGSYKAGGESASSSPSPLPPRSRSSS